MGEPRFGNSSMPSSPAHRSLSKSFCTMASAMKAQVSVQKASFAKPALKASGSRRVAAVARPVSCSAQNEKATAVAAAALAVALGFGQVDAAYADVAGLTPCSESKAFAKREKNEVKLLTKRLKQYEADSAPALALQATIDKTHARFEKYAKQGLLCGTDGLPHLIADPGLALRYGHAGDVFYPTIAFLYFAGWLGWSGSKYLQAVKNDPKPIEKEIIIDVPLAWKLIGDGAVWPLRAVADLRSGDLLEKDSNITVSPR